MAWYLGLLNRQDVVGVLQCLTSLTLFSSSIVICCEKRNKCDY